MNVQPDKINFLAIRNVLIESGIRWSLIQIAGLINSYLHPVHYGSNPSKQKDPVPPPNPQLIELKPVSSCDAREQQASKQPSKNADKLAAFNDILQKLAQQAEDMNLIVILSFDIDNTMHYRSRNAEAMAFEQNVLDQFHQWLTEGAGSKRFILIPNTARPYSDHWRQQMRQQRFPEPFVIIHTNGSKIGFSENQPSWFPDFLEERDALMLASTRLDNILLKHDRIARDQLIDEFGDVPFAQLFSDIQSYPLGTDGEGHVIASTGAVSVFEGVRYDEILWALNQMRLAGTAHKHIHQQADPRYFLYYDRSINKGTALVFLLSQLLPHLPADSRKLLFTAGDDIYDLPMLFMDLLGQTLYAPADRNPIELEGDLAELEISRDDFQLVREIWQAGILPSTKTEELARALSAGDFYLSDRLLWAEEASLHSILNKIYQYIACTQGAGGMQ